MEDQKQITPTTTDGGEPHIKWWLSLTKEQANKAINNDGMFGVMIDAITESDIKRMYIAPPNRANRTAGVGD